MDYLRHVAEESERFLEVLAPLDPDAPVPSCPDWSAADLLWHLTEVQAFWCADVERRATSPSSPGLVRPEEYGELLLLFRRESSRLVEVLASADPSTAVWTWSDDQTVGFVMRRQAHEALIHRIDAELTADLDSEVDGELAADGVDELVMVFLTGTEPWGRFEPNGPTVRLVSRDPEGVWGLQLGSFSGTSPDGAVYDAMPHAVVTDPLLAERVIVGSAADLDVWLWGRGRSRELRGDPAVMEAVRERAALRTQ